MNYILRLLLIVAGISGCAKIAADDVQVQGTIQIISAPTDYKEWKMRKLLMQLAREKNNVTICSLLQPAAVFGSVFFSIATVCYIASIVTGGGNRHSGKDLVESIKNMIELIKAPFTLQYKKNKSRDAIEEIDEVIEKRAIQGVYYY